MKPTLAWAIIDPVMGQLVIFDARTPLYWLRRIAQRDANEHGFTTTGREPDVVIRRVEVREQRKTSKRSTRARGSKTT